LNFSDTIKLLSQLKPDQKPLWGKMTPQHMVEHLYKAVQASINEINLNVFTEERKIPILKKLFLGERALPKEFMNPAIGPELLQLEFKDLNSAINELRNVLQRYEQFFTDNPSIKTSHPIFGHLIKEEWDTFHQKHFKHHLSQFGISD
jgi:oxepin-CoA hydrolase/3-oxo-5,6-dehydrosuberyl-CoA semialdehyde dehydrogenase